MGAAFMLAALLAACGIVYPVTMAGVWCFRRCLGYKKSFRDYMRMI